jgi:hypothetical protein
MLTQEQVDFNEWAINLAEQNEIFRFGKPLRLTALARERWEKEKKEKLKTNKKPKSL